MVRLPPDVDTKVWCISPDEIDCLLWQSVVQNHIFTARNRFSSAARSLDRYLFASLDPAVLVLPWLCEG